MLWQFWFSKIQIIYRLALIVVKILFFTPDRFLKPVRCKKKDCNGKQENGLQKCSIPTLREFATKLHYFQSIFNGLIDFLQLIFSDDVWRQNVNDVANWSHNDAVFHEKIKEFCAHRSIITFGGFGFDFECKNGSEYA
jgi:hypothetical protein